MTGYSYYFWLSRYRNTIFVFINISNNFCKLLASHLRHTQICKNKCIFIPKLFDGLYSLNCILTIQITCLFVLCNFDLSNFGSGLGQKPMSLAFFHHAVFPTTRQRLNGNWGSASTRWCKQLGNSNTSVARGALPTAQHKDVRSLYSWMSPGLLAANSNFHWFRGGQVRGGRWG